MPKKILFFLPSKGLGGSNLFLSREIQKIKENNHSVIVIGKRGDTFGENLTKDIADYHHFSNRILIALNVAGFDIFNSKVENVNKIFKDLIKLIYSFWICIRHISKYNPDYVFVGDFPLLGIIVAAKLRQRKVVTYCLTSKTKSKYKGYFAEKIVGLSDLIIANNNIHLNEWSLDKSKKKRISFAVDRHFELSQDSEFEEWLNKLTIKTKRVILYVGAFGKIKGAYEFVKYAGELLSKYNDVTVLMVGSYHKNYKSSYSEGTSDAALEETKKVFDYISRNDIPEERLMILGQIKHAFELIEYSNILVSMNQYAHQPGPVIEALKCGTAVLAVDDKFSRELIEDGKSGYLIDKNDINKWVSITISLLNNPKSLKVLSKESVDQYHKLINDKDYYEYSDL